MLKNPSKVVGSKQVLKGLSEGAVRCVIVAADADAELKKRLEAAASAEKVPVRYVPTRRRLGELVGVEVPTAAVGILDEAEAQ